MLRVYTRRFINSTNHTFILGINFPQNFLYSSSSSSSNDFKGFMQEYLMNSVGFSQQQAVSTSTKLSNCRKVNHSNLSENVVSVIDLLKNHGFNNTNITKMVSIYPNFLTYDVHSTIKPNLNLLIDHGFSGFDLIQVVTFRPLILGHHFKSIVLPAIIVLKQILVVDAHVIHVMKRLMFRNYYRIIKYLSPNIAFLTSCGVTIESIRKHLLMQPSMFLGDPAVFKDIVIKVEKKMGHPPNSAMFLYGVHLFMFFSEEYIESKCHLFKSFGWTQSDVHTLMVKHPRVFTLSDDNIKKKLEFLTNDMGLEPAHLASNSCFFSYSLEKRVLPRHTVLKVLKEKALMKKVPRLISVLVLTESRFVKMFVLPFEEVHQVYADHIGCTVESLTQNEMI